MGQVIWAPAALADVDGMAEYIARDSTGRAALFVTRVVEAAERLAEFPEPGRVVPEIGHPACREIIVGPYRVMYRLLKGDVWITGLVHGARDGRPL